jgi:predicted transcriptional regulator
LTTACEYRRIQEKTEAALPKTVTIRLDDEVYTELREAAEAENRPLSNLIEVAALARVREQQFVDDAEMAETLANEKLLKRLRAGSRDARARRGRLVG